MFRWFIVFYFYNIFLTYVFDNKRLQTLFKDQPDRSKATCSFKHETCSKTINVKTNTSLQNIFINSLISIQLPSGFITHQLLLETILIKVESNAIYYSAWK